MVRIYTTPSCNGCRKAKKWLGQHDIRYVEKNITAHKLTKNEVLDILKYTENGFEDILSKRSHDYNNIIDKLETMKFNQLIEYIIENPKILKRPILLSDEKNLSIGYNEDDIRLMLPKKERSTVLCSLIDCEDCTNNLKESCKYGF